MNRLKWTFSYPADKLLTAATNKKVFHGGRHKWWADKQEEIVAKLKSQGIEINESVALEYATSLNSMSNSYRGPSVSLDSKLVTDLNECIGKVAEHKSKVRDYEAWMQVLESQGKSTFDLNHDDWLFFFGK